MRPALLYEYIMPCSSRWANTSREWVKVLLTTEVHVSPGATRTVSGMLLQGVSLEFSCFWQDPFSSTSSMFLLKSKTGSQGLSFRELSSPKCKFGVVQHVKSGSQGSLCACSNSVETCRSEEALTIWD